MAGAVVAAAATYFAARSQSHAAQHATDAQTHGTDAALEYQKSRDTVSDQRYQQQWDAYQAYVRDWQARHGAGQNGQPAGQFTLGPKPGAGAAAGPTTPPPVNSGSLQGIAMAPDAMGAAPSGAPADASSMPAAPPATLRELADQFDWKKYGA